MLLPFTYQHQAPEFCSGAFSVILILRNSSDPSIAGCRLTTGYLAVPISNLFARPSDPLNSQPGAHAAGPSSRTTAIDKRTRRPGESGMLTHNMDAKLAEIPAIAARIAQADVPGRPSARFGNICPLRPSMSRRQIFPSGSLPSEQSPGSAVSASLF